LSTEIIPFVCRVDIPITLSSAIRALYTPIPPPPPTPEHNNYDIYYWHERSFHINSANAVVQDACGVNEDVLWRISYISIMFAVLQTTRSTLKIEGLCPYIMFVLCFKYRVYIGPGVENGFSVILFSWIVRGRTKTSCYNTPPRRQCGLVKKIIILIFRFPKYTSIFYIMYLQSKEQVPL